MHHEAKDAHHGGTAVVELNGTLALLGLIAELVPAEVEGAVAEISGELGSAGDVLHDEELEETNKEDELTETGSGDGVGADEGGEAIGVGVEGVAGEVDVSREMEAGAGGDLANEGKHRNAAVLYLDVTKAIEAGLVGVVEKAEGIPVAIVEDVRGTDDIIEARGGSRERCGGLAGLGRGKGGGGASEGGEDSGGLHG